MIIRRFVALCTVCLMMVSTSVCTACGADNSWRRDTSDNLPVSLAATSSDRMYFLPVYEEGASPVSVRQLTALFCEDAFVYECPPVEFSEVVVSESSSPGMRLVESISPRAP